MVTKKEMAPVARAPQDPYPPTKCLCLTEEEELARVAGTAPAGNRTGKRHALVVGICHLKLELENSAAWNFSLIFAHHPFQPPTQSIPLSSVPEWGHPTGHPGVSTGPSLASLLAQGSRSKCTVSFCFRDRNCINELNIGAKTAS